MDTNPAFSPAEQVDTVCTGLTREWYCDKRIAVYSVTSMTTGLVDCWATAASDLIEKWPEKQPYLAIHDLSAKGIALSYLVQVKYDVLNIGISVAGLQSVEKVIARRPGFQAKVAIVFGTNYSGNLGQVFASRDQKRKSNPAVEYKVFFTREQGFSWLDVNANAVKRDSE